MQKTYSIGEDVLITKENKTIDCGNIQWISYSEQLAEVQCYFTGSAELFAFNELEKLED